MAEKDYYKILGVDKNASDDQIKKAYRKLIAKYHPDVCKDADAEERTKEINEAYSVLSDKDKKQMYDTYGTTDPQQAGGFGGFGGFNPFEGFENFGGFSGFNPFGRQRRKTEQKGEDVKVTIKITMEDAYRGVRKKIKINKKVQCKHCSGSGSVDNQIHTCPKCGGSGMVTETKRTQFGVIHQSYPCPECHGTGEVITNPCRHCGGTGLENKEVEVEFNVPEGMPFGACFIVPNQGNDGPNRGKSGDLYVMVEEQKTDREYRLDENNNLLYTLKVNFYDMVFGGDVEVPHFDSPVKFHINPGTESGKVVILPGKGYKNPNTHKNTDYIITIECLIPNVKDLTSEQKNAVKLLK